MRYGKDEFQFKVVGCSVVTSDDADYSASSRLSFFKVAKSPECPGGREGCFAMETWGLGGS